MRRHTKSSSEKILENDGFIRSRLWDGLNVERSAMPLGKVVGVALHGPELDLHDFQLTKVVADSSKSSRRDNL
jgi:hypothetical protein